MERGQQQPALLEVSGLVEQDHRVAPHDRLEHTRALARVKHLGRGGEELLDVLGVAEDHERRLERKPDRDPLAVLLAQPLERRGRPLPRGEQLENHGDARARWKRGHGT